MSYWIYHPQDQEDQYAPNGNDGTWPGQGNTAAAAPMRDIQPQDGMLSDVLPNGTLNGAIHDGANTHPGMPNGILNSAMHDGADTDRGMPNGGI